MCHPERTREGSPTSNVVQDDKLPVLLSLEKKPRSQADRGCMFYMTEALGLSGLGTPRGFGGAGDVEALGQAAALARGGVLVDRVLGRNLVEALHGLLQ